MNKQKEKGASYNTDSKTAPYVLKWKSCSQILIKVTCVVGVL